MKLRLLLAAFFVFSLISVSAQNPTSWRNGSDGIYKCTGLMDAWPEEGPEMLWFFEELGKGHASPIVHKDFLYTTGLIEETGYLFKFDLSGELIYKKAYGPEFNTNFHGPRGTPVIVDDKIYYVTGYGMLLCLNESDGSVVWKKDMVNEFGGEVIRWGYNETPVVDGDVLFCTPGGKANNVMALNRNTGEKIWSSLGKGELTAYCTPLLFEHHGRKILTTHTEKHLLGIDAKTGKLLWSFSHVNKWDVHPNTPIYHNGELFYFSGYGKGGGLLKLNEDGTAVSKVWETDMDSRMGGAVLIDGYIYASGDQNRAWQCIEWATGKSMWSETSIGKGVAIAADDKIYAYSENGGLSMFAVNPAKFELLSKTRVIKGSEQHWAHPIIYKGVLYLRHGSAIIAYKVK